MFNPIFNISAFTADIADYRDFSEEGCSCGKNVVAAGMPTWIIRNSQNIIGPAFGAGMHVFHSISLPSIVLNQKRIYLLSVHEPPWNPDWVKYGDWYRESAYMGAENLVKDGVTAIFCFNDRMAGGVYDYLEDHQLKAGKDIAVVGYDNQEFTLYFRPAITTMEIPVREIGHKTAEILLDIIDDRYDWDINIKNEIEIPCRLIERYSVNCI